MRGVIACRVVIGMVSRGEDCSMSGWSHRHILDLAAFSREDYAVVLETAERFRALPVTGARKAAALQGRLVATLFLSPAPARAAVLSLLPNGCRLT